MSADALTDKPAPEQVAWALGALRDVWEHQQSPIDERIDLIALSLDALIHKQLNAELRTNAIRAAHTLAGSLGTFGFIEASKQARLIESGLEGDPVAGDVLILVQALGRLRDEIREPVRLIDLDQPVLP